MTSNNKPLQLANKLIVFWNGLLLLLLLVLSYSMFSQYNELLHLNWIKANLI